MRNFFDRFKENWLGVIIAFLIIVLCVIIIDLFHFYPNWSELNNVQVGSIHWKTIVFVTIIAIVLFIIAKLKKNILYKLLKRASIYVFITIVFLILSFFVFATNRWATFDTTLPIDTEKWGQFGDFVGGTLGIILSLISVVLIAWTFQTQNKIAETQRFNDLFFELLHLYRSQVHEMSSKYVDMQMGKNDSGDMEKRIKSIVECNDKDFFEIEKEKIQQKYTNQKNYDNNIQTASQIYQSFYADNIDKMSAYFRTLYRIYDLLDNSKLDEQHIKEYLKIVRAQLTESELFFIRYNAMTEYGKNFVKYINKYHVLKHLSITDRLEFKDWWEDMDNKSKLGINTLFYIIEKHIRNSTKESKFGIIEILKGDKYCISLLNKSNSDIQIQLTIYRQQSLTDNKYEFLNTFDSKKIQQLFDCYLKEIFLYYSYKEFNDSESLEFYSDKIKEDTINSIIRINSGVRSINGEKLQLGYQFN